MSPVSLGLELPDSDATDALGRALATSLPAGFVGAVVHLQGELGAGKTTCVRSFLRQVGVTGLVRSPTYTLVETYTPEGLTCVHVDLYRVQSGAEVEELGLRDLLAPDTLMWIEWPDKGGAATPPAALVVALEYAGSSRRARLHAQTPFAGEWLVNLGRDTSLTPYVSNLT